MADRGARARGLQVELAQAGPIPLDARFECVAGELLALVGPSGSGKSTILRAIAGLYRPGKARVTVNGEHWSDSATRVHWPPYRRRVGLVFQSYALFPHLTALENLTVAMGERPASDRVDRASRLLSMMQLEGLAQRRPGELSGGQQQRVAVARALARDPDVLLLDEPFSAVDRATRHSLHAEIISLCRSLDLPVVLVTHDMAEAALLADRMVVLDRGRTLQQGTPEEVTTRPETEEVARLVDVTNVFSGAVSAPTLEDGLPTLDWAGLRLELARRPEATEGSPLRWAIPDGFILLHRVDRPSRGQRENPVACTIVAMAATGQTCQVRLDPIHAPGQWIKLSLPLHVVRRNGLVPGLGITVSLLAEGIHILRGDGWPAPRGP